MYLHYLRRLALYGFLVLAVLLVAGMALTAAGARPYEEPHTWRACLYDDGSNAPCVWDARHQGNHRGHSFKAIPRKRHPKRDPRIVYISHGRGHFLLGWS
jgi:hypothetical protein